MNLALVHDWVVTLGGAENCLKVFHELYPTAPLYSLLYDNNAVAELGFDLANVHATFLQKKKGIQRNYRNYLPIFPFAIEQLDLSDADIILSSSHCAAKGILTRGDQLHVCYCHTPVRYAWDLTYKYLKENNLERGIKAVLAKIALHYLRIWDVQTANRVDHFIANSHYTAQRIWRAYRRESEIIYPPVDVDRFKLTCEKDDYYLFVSRLVPYKKADIVVRAFNELGQPLTIVGDGPQLKDCQRLAGKNIKFLGHQPNKVVADLMSRAKALIFAADEDFGIVPVEAQACGTPVIAYGKGGVTETVIPADGTNWDQATGVFFYEQNVYALKSALEQFVLWQNKFDTVIIHNNALRFSRERFKEEIALSVQRQIDNFQIKGLKFRKTL